MKNKLMLYQGGGYSGCYWEWNFCFWDGNGEWFNIYSSGEDGIESEKAALEYAESIDYPNIIVDLTEQDEVDKMYADFNEDMIVEILRWLNTEHDYGLAVKCAKCGEHTSVDNDQDYFDIENRVCKDCYDDGQCQECFEYDEDLNEDGLCSYCISEQEARLERERIDDLKVEFFEAQLTGEVDIFDDRFRELWNAE